MNFYFDEALAANYKSSSQKIRVMSEHWVGENIFCPCCGNPHIQQLKNNSPVADFQCNNCGEIFELKSKNGRIDTKIVDGAYSTMINRITSDTNPDLFIMQYSNNLEVINLLVVPKFFFVPSIIEKRTPLAPTARRAGWIGCNILLPQVPIQGKIDIIRNKTLLTISDVVEQYNHAKKLQTSNLDSRGWLFDVLNCINTIENQEFNLSEIYQFIDLLQAKHPNNHNIEAKIRQQLQLLRDRGLIEFWGRGKYRKIIN